MTTALRSALRDGPGSTNAALWWALAAGVLYSLLLIAAFPPVGWWGIAFLAIVPLSIAARMNWARPKWAVAAVYAGGLVFWAWQQAWTWSVSEAGYIPLCLYLSIYPALYFIVLRRTVRRWPRPAPALAAAVLWTGLEVLRGEVVWHGYAWALVGHPLIDSVWLSSPAPVAGQYLVSFLVVLTGAGVAEVLVGLARRERRAVLAGIAGPAAAGVVWIVCALVPGPAPGDRPVVIGVVQTNVPQSNKIASTIAVEMDLWNALMVHTEEEASAGAQIIFWPETMKPGLTLDPESVEVERRAGLGYRVQEPGGRQRSVASTAFVDDLFLLQQRAGVPLVVGEDAFEGLRFVQEGGGYRIEYDRRFNSVFVVENGRLSPVRYDKVHLTPFGEQMPYIDAWPWLKDRLLAVAARNMKLDLAEGRGPVTLEATLNDGRVLRFATPICFEMTDAKLCRRMVAAGGMRRAELLANLTNDGWFGDSDRTRAQHLQIARWRARELATPVVRAANTGISAAIDAMGRVMTKPGDPELWGGPPRREARVVRSVTPGAGLTIYARAGDVFTWSVLAAGVVVTIAGAVRRKQPGPGPDGGD